MPITVLSGSAVSAGSANTHTVAITMDSTGADFLILWAVWYGPAGVGTISDNKGNVSWQTSIAQIDNNVGHSGKFFYHANVAAGPSHTLTYTTVGGYCSLHGLAFSGVHLTDPWTGQQATMTQIATVSEVSTPALTPSEAGCLVVTGAGNNGATAATDLFVSIDDGFTLATQIAYASGEYFGGGLGFLIQTAPASVSPTWVLDGVANISAATAVFRPVGAVPPAVPRSPSRWRSVRR